MPLSEIDDPLTRSMSKQKLVCQRLKRYMSLLVTAVEAEISADMSGLNGFMFDGGQLKQVLLAISPMEEGELTAQSHYDFIKKTSYIFHLSESSLAILIGDSCVTNQATETILNVP
ncbi:hypothetical protein F442_03896 [Phytophthora nicotianae P10297]|uniref:Uncharacterized protein n=1 Tax=Phytophthora nicotianae P10297 TaxID=1317064 RepID=W2ZU86_PHYNI|nr:hypothetical protein F442_03896 [Phytophthora nicotianae P10297]